MVLCPFSRSELLIETINRFMKNTIPPYSVKKSMGYILVPDDNADYERNKGAVSRSFSQETASFLFCTNTFQQITACKCDCTISVIILQTVSLANLCHQHSVSLH